MSPLERLASAAVSLSSALPGYDALQHCYQIREMYERHNVQLPLELYGGACVGTAMLLSSSIIAGTLAVRGLRTYRSRS